jgi:hypothetical protein
MIRSTNKAQILYVLFMTANHLISSDKDSPPKSMPIGDAEVNTLHIHDAESSATSYDRSTIPDPEEASMRRCSAQAKSRAQADRFLRSLSGVNR